MWFLSIFLPDVTWLEKKLHHRVPVVPLTAVGIDKTGPSGLPNRIVRFPQFRAGAFDPFSFRVATHFDDSAGESIFSSHGSL
jgi:hypothetical protein